VPYLDWLPNDWQLLIISSEEDLQSCYETAYAGEVQPLEEIHYMAGQAIPNDPGKPAAGEKRALPPPPTLEQGGNSPA
jgi:hypothetical protein